MKRGYTARVLGGDQSQISHQLARMRKAPKVSEFGDDGGGGDEVFWASTLEICSEVPTYTLTIFICFKGASSYEDSSSS